MSKPDVAIAQRCELASPSNLAGAHLSIHAGNTSSTGPSGPTRSYGQGSGGLSNVMGCVSEIINDIDDDVDAISHHANPSPCASKCIGENVVNHEIESVVHESRSKDIVLENLAIAVKQLSEQVHDQQSMSVHEAPIKNATARIASDMCCL